MYELLANLIAARNLDITQERESDVNELHIGLCEIIIENAHDSECSTHQFRCNEYFHTNCLRLSEPRLQCKTKGDH